MRPADRTKGLVLPRADRGDRGLRPCLGLDRDDRARKSGLLYAERSGGARAERAQGIAVTDAGEAIVVGAHEQTIDMGDAGTATPSSVGERPSPTLGRSETPPGAAHPELSPGRSLGMG